MLFLTLVIMRVSIPTNENSVSFRKAIKCFKSGNFIEVQKLYWRMEMVFIRFDTIVSSHKGSGRDTYTEHHVVKALTGGMFSYHYLVIILSLSCHYLLFV